MRRVLVLVALAGGCADEKKPSEQPAPPANPAFDKQEEPAPGGKKQTGPGMTRLPATAGGALRGA